MKKQLGNEATIKFGMVILMVFLAITMIPMAVEILPIAIGGLMGISIIGSVLIYQK